MNEKPTSYLEAMYKEKSPDYYAGGRSDFVGWLEANPNARILELGSGDGSTSALAKASAKCKEYVGIEMFEEAAQKSRAVIDKVHIGDVDQLKLPYPENYFDALIMSEVIEHLIDPEDTVRKLLKLVRTDGLVMASSPNVASFQMILQLWNGRFDYQDSGYMDRTHLRWFTPETFREFFEDLGLKTEIHQPLALMSLWKRIILRMAALGKHHLHWGQINYVGRKRP